jgi:RimJ/RimL family protein N-acetyltransferase
MRLVKNLPLDTNVIADLITNPDDLYLVWPKAKYPFDNEQWREVLNPDAGNVPFLVYNNSQLIGHAALLSTEDANTFTVGYLYIKPNLRSKGMGEEMINLLEQYAKDYLQAKKLCLVVRTYNPRAQRCYSKCGFLEDGREDTLIKMSKLL